MSAPQQDPCEFPSQHTAPARRGPCPPLLPPAPAPALSDSGVSTFRQYPGMARTLSRPAHTAPSGQVRQVMEVLVTQSSR